MIDPAIPNGPVGQTVDYSLDAAGNRLNDPSAGSGQAPASYNAADQRNGFSYDANGNLLSDGATTYTYDAANRLTQTVTDGITTTYAYDGWGTLIRETRNGRTTDMVLDEQAALPRVLAAIRSDGQEELYAYGPEGLHAQRTITGTLDTTSYALLDAQGSLKQKSCHTISVRPTHSSASEYRHQNVSS